MRAAGKEREWKGVEDVILKKAFAFDRLREIGKPRLAGPYGCVHSLYALPSSTSLLVISIDIYSIGYYLTNFKSFFFSF